MKELFISTLVALTVLSPVVAHPIKRPEVKKFRVPYRTTCELEYKVFNGKLIGPKQNCKSLFKYISEYPAPQKTQSDVIEIDGVIYERKHTHKH